MFSGQVGITFILSLPLCLEDRQTGIGDDLAKTKVMATLFLVCGIITLLQTTFGSRWVTPVQKPKSIFSYNFLLANIKINFGQKVVGHQLRHNPFK